MESVSRCSTLAQPEKCSKYKISILPKSIDCFYLSRLCTSWLFWKSHEYQKWSDSVSKSLLITTSIALNYAERYLTSSTRRLSCNIEIRIQGIPHAAVEEGENDRIRWSRDQCTKSRIYQSKMHQSLICRTILRKILQWKIKEDDSWHGECGMLRAVRALALRFSVHTFFCIGPKASSSVRVGHAWSPQNIQNDRRRRKFDTGTREHVMVLATEKNWSTTRVSPSEGLFIESFQEQILLNPPANPTERYIQRIAASFRMGRTYLWTFRQDREWRPLLHRHVVRAATVRKQLEACLKCKR